MSGSSCRRRRPRLPTPNLLTFVCAQTSYVPFSPRFIISHTGLSGRCCPDLFPAGTTVATAASMPLFGRSPCGYMQVQDRVLAGCRNFDRLIRPIRLGLPKVFREEVISGACSPSAYYYHFQGGFDCSLMHLHRLLLRNLLEPSLPAGT